MNKYFFITLLLAVAMLMACQEDTKESNWVADEDIAMTSEELLTDESPLGDMPIYIETEEGESESFNRAFENAPPMIPHKTRGLVPITIDNNLCVRCHMPDKSREIGSTPLPQSHFTAYRPELTEKDGLFQVDAEENEVVMEDLDGKLSAAMFNCTMCHAPQAEVTVDIENLFTPAFRKSNGKSKSNLSDVIDEGVK
ncbi:MAG: nitrate reductase cytochrome c-type subunit [Bacteroidota bacterium]|nr:nitrate reductase cytochrome c-type subunit [Bacteroidota bacterium]